MRRLVAATAAALALALTLGASAAVAAECDAGGWAGNCDVNNSGTQVDVSGSLHGPGGGGGSRGDGRNDHGDAPRAEAPARPGEENDCETIGRCGGYSVVTFPDVTLADLASFRPAEPTLTGEPSGFGVVGMPANVVAEASEQRIPGTVLGWDVTVRFTPRAFVFDYGDGSRSRSSTGGATWASLGQPQFTPTSTSHVYRSRGTYPVSVTVEYAASVDFGNGAWRTVPGVVTATASDYEVRVVEVRTALVERTCAEDPSGPGC